MVEALEIAIIVDSGLLGSVGGILLGVWQDIKGKQLPKFETSDNPQDDVKPVQKKGNIHERGAFVIGCAILSGAVGAMIGLFYLGFMAEETIPNAYGRAFISLGAGFLMPRLLEHSESLSISNLVKRFFDK
jgi:cytochrome c biogenesis protein ResB